jgi:transposase InsO family protein
VATWAGFVYVAFVIDAYARRIVGWRVSRTAHAKTSNKFSPEVRARAVRMVLDHEGEHPSRT